MDSKDKHRVLVIGWRQDVARVVERLDTKGVDVSTLDEFSTNEPPRTASTVIYVFSADTHASSTLNGLCSTVHALTGSQEEWLIGLEGWDKQRQVFHSLISVPVLGLDEAVKRLGQNSRHE